MWREGILIEDNYIHDVALEGMYVGANYGDGDLPVRNVEIRNNRVEDIGFDGINTKSMWAGDNRIHHNIVRRAGKNSARSSDSSQYSGIKNNAGTVKIYNNWVESTGQHGIQSWTHQGPRASEGKGPFEAEIWNNVIVGAGELWRSFMGDSFGISVGAQAGTEKPIPSIYNNTIVDSRRSAISVTRDAAAGVVRDNIAAGTGSNPVISVPGHVELAEQSHGVSRPDGVRGPEPHGLPAENQQSRAERGHERLPADRIIPMLRDPRRAPQTRAPSRAAARRGIVCRRRDRIPAAATLSQIRPASRLYGD